MEAAAEKIKASEAKLAEQQSEARKQQDALRNASAEAEAKVKKEAAEASTGQGSEQPGVATMAEEMAEDEFRCSICFDRPSIDHLR